MADFPAIIMDIQAEDLNQVKKLVPDLVTWLQCFTIYAAAIG